MLTAFWSMETESCWIIPEKKIGGGGGGGGCEFQNNHECLESIV